MTEMTVPELIEQCEKEAELGSYMPELFRALAVKLKELQSCERERAEWEATANRNAKLFDAANAENHRLAYEVSNRNRRALEGDEAKAALDRLFDKSEAMRVLLGKTAKSLQSTLSFMEQHSRPNEISSKARLVLDEVADFKRRGAPYD